MFLASAGILLLAVASAARMRGMKIGDEPMKALVAISGLLIILAPLYLAFGLPGAFTADGQAGGGGGSYDSDAGFGKSFVGTNSTTAFGNTISWSWSPTWGWLFALVGGLLILLGAALAGAPPRPAAADAPQSGWTAASPQQSWTPGQAQPVPTPPARPAPLDERYATRSFP
jgi:hypothetical protein